MNWLAGYDASWTLDWFGTDGDGNVIPPYGPPGVATFVLDIENGFTVTHRWNTDIEKFYGGVESRASRNDAPQQSYSGSAVMLGDVPRNVRSTMAKYAALGSQFLLGLPHEQLDIAKDSVGTTVYVSTTAYCDWSRPGQRVVVARDGASVSAVVQSQTLTTIVLDVAPGAVGKLGGVIMPAVPVYLEPQQDFPRYPDRAERWNIQARAALMDFAPKAASLALNTVYTLPALAGVVIVDRKTGLSGNGDIFGLYTGGPATGSLFEGDGLVNVLIQSAVTTMGSLAAIMATSAFQMMTGTWNPADVIVAGAGFGNDYGLDGGTASGAIGTGAAVTTLVDGPTTIPVWDRPLENKDTSSDSVIAMSIIVDHGGVPYALGTADQADWGRNVVLTGGDPIQWQWLKLFLATVKGAQKSWLLPTWRNDLTFVSKAANTVTVTGGDFFAWFPLQRQYVQVVETSGTITRAKISAALDNGDGTVTLTIGVTIASSSVRLISWLEQCRFEKDEFTFTFDESGVSL